MKTQFKSIIKCLFSVFILSISNCAQYSAQDERSSDKSLQLIFDSRLNENSTLIPPFTALEYRELRYGRGGAYKMPYFIYKDSSYYYIYTLHYSLFERNDSDDMIKKSSIRIANDEVERTVCNFRKFRLIGEYQNNEQCYTGGPDRRPSKAYFDYVMSALTSKKGPYSQYWVYSDGNTYYILFDKISPSVSPKYIKENSVLIPVEKADEVKRNSMFQHRWVFQSGQLASSELSPPFYSEGDYTVLFHQLFPKLPINTKFEVYCNYGRRLRFEHEVGLWRRLFSSIEDRQKSIWIWESDAILKTINRGLEQKK